MPKRTQATPPETFTFRSNLGAEAAEAMAQARPGDIEARAAYSRLLFEQSKSFGDYIRHKVGIGNLRKAG